MQNIKLLVATTLFTVSIGASAGNLVTDGTIVAVTSKIGNQASFGVKVSGGSTNLCEGEYIVFPEADAADKEAHARAYATALAVLTSGLPVRIYNYVDNLCKRASYIEILR